jgi:hypothetical protein
MVGGLEVVLMGAILDRAASAIPEPKKIVFIFNAL